MAKNIITINNKHYDAGTGELLATTESPYIPEVHHKQQADESSKKPVRHRQAAQHIAPHAPKPSQTLMRRAVKKPGVAEGRHLKVQGQVDQLARSPLQFVALKPSAKKIDAHRLRHAKKTNKSQLVSHFSPVISYRTSPLAVSAVHPAHFEHVDQAADARQAVTISRQNFMRSQVAKPKTTAELLEYALQQATSHEQLPPQLPRRHLFRRWLVTSAG